MMNHCFMEQKTTTRILEFVANVCSECYGEFSEGDTVYYDGEECRYLCMECAKSICEEKMEASTSFAEDTRDESTLTLF